MPSLSLCRLAVLVTLLLFCCCFAAVRWQIRCPAVVGADGSTILYPLILALFMQQACFAEVLLFFPFTAAVVPSSFRSHSVIVSSGLLCLVFASIFTFLGQNPYCEEDMRRNKECTVGISNVHAVKVHVENGKIALKRSAVSTVQYSRRSVGPTASGGFLVLRKHTYL